MASVFQSGHALRMGLTDTFVLTVEFAKMGF
jgi:hypothetical protein